MIQRRWEGQRKGGQGRQCQTEDNVCGVPGQGRGAGVQVRQ